MNEYKLKRWEVEKLGITTNNTQVERIPQSGGVVTLVTLHHTDIVKITDYQTSGEMHITLDTGGYNTVTTRRRMNEVSQAYGLGFQVYQKDYQLFVDYKGHTQAFDRTIKLQQS